MTCEFDETVRNYSKLFKGDITRKTNYFKCEEFSGTNSLDNIAQELNSINIQKENMAINKSILIKNNLWKDPKE